MSIQDYKCPNCNGSLRFDPGEQVMLCEFCDSKMDMASFREFEAADRAQDEINDLGSYQGTEWEVNGQFCNSCNGELIACDMTIATECPYCGNASIVSKAISGNLRPDFVIPFKIDKDGAKERLKRHYKGFLLPKCFRDNNHIENVTGLYVPFWLYDCNAHVQAAYNAQNVSSWTSGNTRFTRTDKFMVTRAGVLGFDKVPVEASSKMDKADMEAIEPYNYGEMQAFSSAFLAGHVAERYDRDFDSQKSRINQRINSSCGQACDNTVRGYTTMNRRNLNVNVQNSKISYALMPVWMLSTQYKGKAYKFCMNGQTGQSTGALPTCNKKKVGLGAAITGGFALVGALLIMLLAIAGVTAVDPTMSMGVSAALGAVFGFIGGAVLGLLVAGAVIMYMSHKMKSIRRHNSAHKYTRGFDLTHQNAIFLGSHTTRMNIGSNMSGGMGMGGRPGGMGGRPGGGFRGGGFRR